MLKSFLTNQSSSDFCVNYKAGVYLPILFFGDFIMTDSEQLLKKRFEELSSRSFAKGIWVYSDFLTVAEQSALLTMRLPSPVTLNGGFEGAERRIACFGSEESCGYEAYPPYTCIKIEPVRQKFADELHHRDFFGSVMALGIKREVLGDIIVYENCGYLFCLEGIAEYICENLTGVRRTSVKCIAVSSPPVASVALPDEEEFVIASPRVDAVAAAVYKLSRSTAKELVEKGLVSINSVVTLNADTLLEPHDTVSVRGSGRFIFEGELRQTKKGRLRAGIRVYR